MYTRNLECHPGGLVKSNITCPVLFATNDACILKELRLLSNQLIKRCLRPVSASRGLNKFPTGESKDMTFLLAPSLTLEPRWMHPFFLWSLWRALASRQNAIILNFDKDTRCTFTGGWQLLDLPHFSLHATIYHTTVLIQNSKEQQGTFCKKYKCYV